MSDHSARQHALWAPSSSDRNRACPGAPAYAGDAERTTNVYAARGTVGHELVQKALIAESLLDYALVGTTVKKDGFDITIDEALIDGCNLYVNHCLSLINEDTDHWLEQRVSLSKLDLAVECGGTADFSAYKRRYYQLHIVDLKTGFEDVSPIRNWQTRSYAIGTLLEHPELDVRELHITIVQPMSSKPIKTEIISVGELALWAIELRKANAAAGQARDELLTLDWDAWAAKWLRPSAECDYCPRAGVCPALRGTALQAKKVSYSNLPPEEIAKLLEQAELLELWTKGLRGHARVQIDNGVDVPEWMIATRFGHRKLINKDATVAELKAAGVAEADMFETPDLKSPAQLEKIKGLPKELKAKFKTDHVNALVKVEISGSYLTRREAGKVEAESKVQKWFDPNAN